MLHFTSSASFLLHKFQHTCTRIYPRLDYLRKLLGCLIIATYHFILYHVSSFLVQLCYFFSFSFLGFLLLRSLKTRTHPTMPRDLDFFFMSVSAITVSSMSTVEMEVFSNAQLLVLTLLMFMGGEVFFSMVGLRFKCAKLIKPWKVDRHSRVNSVTSSPAHSDHHFEIIELGSISTSTAQLPPPAVPAHDHQFHKTRSEIEMQNMFLKYKSIRLLGFIVLGYLLTIHLVGVSTVWVYVSTIPSARKTLEGKGLKSFTFSLFTVVSTFASCGFVPTNENMAIFSKNSGLLLVLIPHVLFGNTLFPPFLRFCIWSLGRLVKKNDSIDFLLKNTDDVGYFHLLPPMQSVSLVITVFAFILVQFVLFCSMQWHSEVLSGLNSYQKLVGALFLCVNSRHTGETVVDLSAIAPPMLVLFVVMMYLPPYTSFLPVQDDEQSHLAVGRGKKKSGKIQENLIFSQIAYLAIFVIMICITERHKMKDDPLNFNVFTIVVEVISLNELQRAVPPLLKYGKYCGLLYSGCPGEKPCDDLDACCMRHDACVQARDNDYLSKECSQNFINCMESFKSSGAHTFKGNMCDPEEVISVIKVVMEAALFAGKVFNKP